MPKVFINNIEIEANAGETIIEVAKKNEIYIPHFCWHPELSISGNCRMCLVEVGNPKRNPDGSFALDENNNKIILYIPKLQIACNTTVSEEMRINTNTQKVVDARASVMEFLLINHPLDCPICDEAGNCKLQNYSEKYSTHGSRFTETKNQNPKRIDWNDKIIYDAERCISCSRCIRWTKEIMHEDVLTFINRGDRVRIERFEDAKIQNDYSMNVIDNCPVGALTSKDFRFKSRVWEMSFNDSICTLCSRGCKIKIGAKNNEVLRVESAEISPNCNSNNNCNSSNSHSYNHKNWICDFGRLKMPSQINNKRLSNPKGRKNGVFEEKISWKEAISTAVSLLKKYKSNEIYFIASPLASNESNSLLVELANKISFCT
jgi:NADH-quinone oxidoreductase subunit G